MTAPLFLSYDMPHDVPIENIIAVTQAVLRTEEICELFTLDPDQCAACIYMVRSVTDSYVSIKDIADYVVYRYNNKTDIARTSKRQKACEKLIQWIRPHRFCGRIFKKPIVDKVK